MTPVWGCDSNFIWPLKDTTLRLVSLCTSPSGTTSFISKEMWPGPLSCTTWTKRDCKKKKKSDIKDRKRCAERFPSNAPRHIRFPYVASLKSYVRVVYIQAGAHHYGLLIQEDSQRPAPSWLVNSIGRALHLYRSTLGTRGFSRVRREFSVLAEGRHIFAYLARKVSGTQGRSRVRIPYKPDFFRVSFAHCEKMRRKCDDLLPYNSAHFVISLINFRGKRFCRAPLGQMFNSWCISCTIYNIHSGDWRLGFTILWRIIIWSFFTCINSDLLVT